MTKESHSAQRMHIAGLLEEAADKYPENVFIAGDAPLRYAEAVLRVRAIGNGLRARGVKQGDRVLILTENRAELVLAAYATCAIGGVFVVLNPHIRATGLKEIISQCSPAAALLDDSTAELAEVTNLGTVFYCGKGDAPVGAVSLEDLFSGEYTKEIRLTGNADDPACLVYTSGSTGVPRGVMLSHGNIRFVVNAIQARLQYRSDDVIGNFLPMSFDYGLYQMFLAAFSGAALYVGKPEMVGPRLLNIMGREQVSVLPAVPAMCTALLMMMGRRAHQLPRFRAITNTGEQLPLANVDLLLKHFPQLQVFVMYGLTECKRVSILLPEELSGEHRDAVGRPLDGTEVFAVDEVGNRLPAGEVGELVIRGPHVALGYWNAPEETAQRFPKYGEGGARELSSGDLGSVDAEGFIRFIGRNDDMLKNRGFRISPLETENAACAIEGVIEAGLVKRERDETLHLFVTTKAGSVDDSTILKKLRENLEPAKIPDHVYTLETMPKTLNGKLDRKALVEKIEGI